VYVYLGVFARVGQNHTFIVIYGVRIFGGVIARVGQNHTFIVTYVGLARTIYIRCICGIFGREITKYTVIYGVYIRLWPTLYIRCTYVRTVFLAGELPCMHMVIYGAGIRLWPNLNIAHPTDAQRTEERTERVGHTLHMFGALSL